jgi:oxalate decarboxylase/phosphoglucose isomerase-like protein (cupin superfamily)
MFLVLAGRATVRVGAQSASIGRGEAIFLPPFELHEIHNIDDEPFDIVSVYWCPIRMKVAPSGEVGTRRGTGPDGLGTRRLLGRFIRFRVV